MLYKGFCFTVSFIYPAYYAFDLLCSYALVGIVQFIVLNLILMRKQKGIYVWT